MFLIKCGGLQGLWTKNKRTDDFIRFVPKYFAELLDRPVDQEELEAFWIHDDDLGLAKAHLKNFSGAHIVHTSGKTADLKSMEPDIPASLREGQDDPDKAGEKVKKGDKRITHQKGKAKKEGTIRLKRVTKWGTKVNDSGRPVKEPPTIEEE